MILAINTGSDKNSIALFGKNIAEEIIWNSYHASPRLRVASRTQSKELLPKIDQILKRNKVRPSDLLGIAVYQGPGSYTGLRVGISVANSLAWGLDVPVIGIKQSSVTSDQLPALEIAKKAEKIYRKTKNKQFSKLVIPFYDFALK